MIYSISLSIANDSLQSVSIVEQGTINWRAFFWTKHLCVIGVHSTNAYKNANETIERYTKIFTSILFVNTVILLLPPLVYSMVNYYFLDTGKESFFLFFPAWFVLTIEIEILKGSYSRFFVCIFEGGHLIGEHRSGT